MSDTCQTPLEELCGCCSGIGPETPQPIANRPALSAVAYRVGTHTTFKASMLAALSDPTLAALAPLRTRDDSDFSIALLDAWAVTSDILTFYQERIANEAYLRTAIEGRSVFELARLVGYQPSPGVAASAFIAFTLNDAPGSPGEVLISAGTRVQSVPGPGETPQTFETADDLKATIAYNALVAQTTLPWSLSSGDTFTWIQGTSNNLNVGDALLFVSAQLESSLTSGPVDLHFVSSVTTNSSANTTYVEWDQPLSTTFGANSSGVRVYALRKKAALFGVQAPNPRLLSTKDTGIANLPGYPTDPNAKDWNYSVSYQNNGQISLDAVYAGLAPATNGNPQWLAAIWPAYTAVFRITAATDLGPALYTLTSKATQVTLANGQVLLNAISNQLLNLVIQDFQWYTIFLSLGLPTAGILAKLQQDWTAYENSLNPTNDALLTSMAQATRNATVYAQSDLLTPAAAPLLAWSGIYSRQKGLLRPVEGSSLEIVGGQQLTSGQPVAISGKLLRLSVISGSAATFILDGSSNNLAVSDGQTFIVNLYPPANDAGGQLWNVSTTSGVRGSLTLQPANLTLLPADKNDAVVSESAVINHTAVAGPITTLFFAGPLLRIYDRSTVTVNANVVDATQGETMHEILGSGDATNPSLQFTLKQSPLTYVSSPSGLGASSTLQVWVNNLRWQEAANFLSAGASDRVFTTRPEQNGKVSVQFGDGVQGSRPPSGQMNIRAVYRKGIGAAGMVAAGQLSQPLDRPQGLKSASNPDPATGGADPDTPEDARTSAPLHVLTLDRVVSLADYQNFARAFAGIQKALATWTWFGRARGVFLTIAGADGATFEAGDPTVVNLLKALRSAGNPFIPLQVMSYLPVFFEIAANVRVDTNFDPVLVLKQVWSALSAAFAFENRSLGQGVAQSEIIQLIQQVPGVVAVALTAFNRRGETATNPLVTILRAASPISGTNVIPQPAELLLLDPASQAAIGVWS